MTDSKDKVDGPVAAAWLGYIILVGGIAGLAGWGWAAVTAGSLLIIGSVIAINDNEPAPPPGTPPGGGRRTRCHQHGRRESRTPAAT